MAAVIDLRTGTRLAPECVQFAPVGAAPLRVIQGGRSGSARRMRRVYLVRRLLVAVALVAALMVVLSAVRAAGSGSAVQSSMPAISGQTYVVQPGDTLWAIAGALEPDADPRDVVDRLIELNSTDGPSLAAVPLEVGRELALGSATD